MSNLLTSLADLSAQGSSNSSISFNELLLSQGSAASNTKGGTPMAPAPAGNPVLAPATGTDSAATAASTSFDTSTATTPLGQSTAPSATVVSLAPVDASPSLPLDGVLVGWNPLSSTSTSTTPLSDTTAPSATVVSLAPADASPSLSLPFDGLLVGWNPLSTAEERASARAALGLGLTETIHTRAMQASGSGPIEWVRLPQGLSAEQAMAALAKRPGVIYAEKNWLLQTQAISNDPYATNGSLWGMYGDGSSPSNPYGSQAAEAWNAGYTGSNTVYVGIIDEGYQYTHADLRDNAGTNPGEIDGNGIDDDKNGYVDDFYGWDFDGNNKSVYDGTGDDHGTHVAGTIGASGGNGIGVAGVNWNVKLLNAKFLGSQGGTTANAIKAVDYFTNLKIQQVLNIVATNNSWGGGGYSTGLHEAIIRSANAGILFVAAAGNGGSDGVGDNNDSVANYPSNYNATVKPTNSIVTPASYDNVIAVAAITSSGARSSFSNYGATTVDLGAPGSGIWSTVPEATPAGPYASYSGTSMATPQVTGAAALLSSVYPTASAEQIKLALLTGAAPTSSLNGITVSNGRLDIPTAITKLGALVDPNAPTYAISGPTSASEGSNLAFTISTTNVAANTQLYWRMSGTGINNEDFVGLPALNGTLAVGTNGSTVFTTTVAADLLTEGSEKLTFEIFKESSFTSRLAATSPLPINDSSLSPITWGTQDTENITGTTGAEGITGVQSSGTSASNMGAGQVDTLTGLAGRDVFLLGDGRGVFYDDRSSKSLGNADYALITDFQLGTDKLQVQAGTSYVSTVSGGNLILFWDRNNNGLVTSTGNNLDERIAVLQGVTTLTSADLIWV